MFEERALGDSNLAHWERVLKSGGSVSSGCQRKHGTRLFFLASDFLCQTCQHRFVDLDIDAHQTHEVEEWVARMQCATFPERGDAARAFLAEEQSRLRVRTDAMELAARAVASADDLLSAFAQFQEVLDPSAFERSRVESAIQPVQRSVVVSSHVMPYAVSYTHLTLPTNREV